MDTFYISPPQTQSRRQIFPKATRDKAFMLTKLHIIFQYAFQNTKSRTSIALERNRSIEPNSSNAARLHVAVCCIKHARQVDSKKQGNKQPVQRSRHQHNLSLEQNSGKHRRSIINLAQTMRFTLYVQKLSKN